jgi:hypothetical protein
MSIFTPITPVSPPLDAANRVKTSGNQLYKQMVNVYTSHYNLVWNNPKATPDKIVSAMGTDAQKIFAASAGLAQYLVALGVTGIQTTMPSGWTYTANADGSVTLTET